MNPESIHIPGHKKLSRIPTSHIAYFEAETNQGASYSYLHYIDFKRSELVTATLKHFERLLPDFIRVSKHILVNPAVIDTIISENSRKASIVLINGNQYVIPRRRIAMVSELVKSHTDMLQQTY